MTEDYLHYLWKSGNFSIQDLCTTDGEQLKVLFPGYHNTDAGPDFSEARIQIGSHTWVGPVEIHVRAREWFRHGHEKDPAYRNVVLHVVYIHDTEVYYPSGEKIPGLELKGRIEEYRYWRFEQLVRGQRFIPCQNQLSLVDPDFIRLQYDQWVVERLRLKSRRLIDINRQCHQNWQESFYRFFCYGMGLSVNAEAFYSLSERIPYGILSRHRSNPIQVEALLFGVSGLLANVEEEYPLLLKEEYTFLKTKYSLEEMEPLQWKFARMRPAGFPTIRMAQLAAVFVKSGLYFEEGMELEKRRFMKWFDAAPSPYWKNHYRFNKVSQTGSKKPGKTLVEKMFINVLLPFVFYYSEYCGFTGNKSSWMEQLADYPHENNQIIRKMKSLGFPVENARDGQAVLHVFKDLCSYKKCLHCAVGNKLLNI